MSGAPPRPDPAELARVRRELARASGRRRVDLILEASDPEALVRALPADELYFVVRELGLADAAELAQLASPEQFRVFLDLDAWRAGRVDPRRILPWLHAARPPAAAADPEGEARGKRKLAALDPELLGLALRSALRIHDLEEDPDPRIRSTRFLRSPEGRYLVEFDVEGTDYLAVRGILDDLYAEDPLRAARLLEALRWELPSELEEAALRLRNGRLADLGYPDLEEALSWFARPPRAPGGQAGLPGRGPGFFLAALERGALLDRAAARLAGGEREAFEGELVAAANAVLVADAVDPGDPEAVRRAAESARALLELGLAALSGGDEARAAEVLATVPLKRVFQHGFGRLLERRWRAERILRSGRPLGPPLDEMLRALARRRPMYYPGVEVPRGAWGTEAAGGFEPRAFLSAQDLARTDEALGVAEARAGDEP